MSSSEDRAIPRRDLLQGAAGLFVAMPLCCSTPALPPDCLAYDGSALLVDLTRATELRRVGSARAVVDAGRKLNILVAHAAKDRFVALDRACTHGGAPCTYDHKRQTLRCTSLNHAEFDLQGTLLHGRTHGNLRGYGVRRTGDTLRIDLERSA